MKEYTQGCLHPDNCKHFKENNKKCIHVDSTGGCLVHDELFHSPKQIEATKKALDVRSFEDFQTVQSILNQEFNKALKNGGAALQAQFHRQANHTEPVRSQPISQDDIDDLKLVLGAVSGPEELIKALDRLEGVEPK